MTRRQRRLEIEALTLEKLIHLALCQAELAGDEDLFDTLLRALGLVLRRRREAV